MENCYSFEKADRFHKVLAYITSLWESTIATLASVDLDNNLLLRLLLNRKQQLGIVDNW